MSDLEYFDLDLYRWPFRWHVGSEVCTYWIHILADWSRSSVRNSLPRNKVCHSLVEIHDGAWASCLYVLLLLPWKMVVIVTATVTRGHFKVSRSTLIGDMLDLWLVSLTTLWLAYHRKTHLSQCFMGSSRTVYLTLTLRLGKVARTEAYKYSMPIY